MTGLLISIIAFFVAIGVLVTFHELGHFWVARLLGVKVLRFSVGFGKALWRFQGKETEYVIAAIPIGGYVKMLDEREGPVEDSQKSFAFNTKPVWARFAIVLAGPVFNFVFAIVAYWLMYMIGITGLAPMVGEIKPDSIAAKAGLLEKDEIIKVDGQPTHSWQQVVNKLIDRLGDKDNLSIEVLRDKGQHKALNLQLETWQLKGDRPSLIDALGITPYQPPIPPIVSDVIADEPAGVAGIVAGDEVIAVNHRSITQWREFTDVVHNSVNKPITLTVKRKDKVIDFTFMPRTKESDTGEIIGFAGLVVKALDMPAELLRNERYSPWDAFVEANKKTADYIRLTFKVIGKMITGSVGLKTLSGPLSIAEGAGASALGGIQYFLGFLALISISLGVLNLLPIPILDGGHLLYFVIEAIQGKPVSDRVQIYGFKLGMLLLIFLMTIAIYNDLARLF
ncbi:MAG: sigma E protease regulator RseP [Candidatus Berkiella sp.]